MKRLDASKTGEERLNHGRSTPQSEPQDAVQLGRAFH
jgi:hypothetical protein